VSARNPDLPILEELGAEFETLVRTTYAAEGERGATAARRGQPERERTAVPGDRPTPDRHTVRRRAPLPASRGAGERGAQARRIGRRAAIVLVLICLVGGVALAALRGGGDSGGEAHTTPALLGRDDAGAWSFSVYRDEGRLCTVFVPRGGELSGNCGTAPDRGHLRAGSAIAAGRRYVFGLTGPEVERVTAALAVPGAAASVAGRAIAAARVRGPGDKGAARGAGFPAGDGWFVVDLGPVHRIRRPGAPAVVTPFTRHGHRVGPAYVDCSLGVIAPACRRRIESAARG
jgi:hypothetical protein